MWVLGEEAATNLLLGAVGQEAWPLWPECPHLQMEAPLDRLLCWFSCKHSEVLGVPPSSSYFIVHCSLSLHSRNCPLTIEFPPLLARTPECPDLCPRPEQRVLYQGPRCPIGLGTQVGAQAVRKLFRSAPLSQPSAPDLSSHPSEAGG